MHSCVTDFHIYSIVRFEIFVTLERVILFYLFFFSMSDLFAKIVAAMAAVGQGGVEDEAARRAAAGTTSSIISDSSGTDGSSAATAASTAFLGVEFFFGSILSKNVPTP